MKYYLTDKIFIKDNDYYYESDNQENKIKETNWHIHLNEYGWMKLNKKWIIILNKLLETKKKKNSKFGILDCTIEDGDCLFSCICYAMKDIYNTFDHMTLRKDLSNIITDEVFTNIIDLYRISKVYNEFNESWDPDTITIEEFKLKLREGGNEYWGDFLILNLLKEYLNINFIILYSNDLTKKYYNYPLFYEYDKNIQTIILLYEDDSHFKLIGNFQGNTMVTLFSHKTIPKEILYLIKQIR